MYPEPDVFVWGSSVYRKWLRSRPIFGPFSQARNVLGLCRKGPRRYNFALRSMKGKKTTTSKQKQINIIIMSLFNICILWISWGDQIFKVAHGLNDSDKINYILQHSNRGDASICIDMILLCMLYNLLCLPKGWFQYFAFCPMCLPQVEKYYSLLQLYLFSCFFTGHFHKVVRNGRNIEKDSEFIVSWVSQTQGRREACSVLQ